MTTLESFLLSYLLNALWQVPLLFASGWLVARALRKLGAAAEHRVWVGTLLLQALLPALSALPWDFLRSLFRLPDTPLRNADPHVSVVMGAGATFGSRLPGSLLAGTAIAYAVAIAYFAARFAWRLHKTRSLRRNAAHIELPAEAARHWTQCAHTFGVSHASIAVSSQVFGPVTIGIAHKLVLLPARMLQALPEAELRAAIAHEFAHMRRHDFLKNLAYELLSLPISFHPVFRLTRERLTESREMVCDQIAAEITNRFANPSGEPHPYARSLLRLASLLVDATPNRTPHAIGIFDATTFERRVMKLTEKQTRVSARRRFAAVAASALLGLATCASAVALSLHVDPIAGDEKAATSPHDPVNVSPDVMAAQLLKKTTPVYPPDAKKARIQGTVKLNAIIGKDGAVEQLKVISGPAELQQSSLDAVHQWTYKPFLLNGEPVEVKTTININYSLKK
jgi:TonB family protein